MRNCKLTDFTSIQDQSQLWKDNRKHWFDTKNQKGLMACPESTEFINMKHNMQHTEYEYFQLEVVPCSQQENPRCVTDPTRLNQFLKEFGFRVNYF